MTSFTAITNLSLVMVLALVVEGEGKQHPGRFSILQSGGQDRNRNNQENSPTATDLLAGAAIIFVVILILLCCIFFPLCIVLIRRMSTRPVERSEPIHEGGTTRQRPQHKEPEVKIATPLCRYAALGHLNPPDHFICPISQEVMHDPVLCSDGYHNFERGFISKYLLMGHSTCPISRRQMTEEDLQSNVPLKEEIEAWVESVGGLPRTDEASGEAKDEGHAPYGTDTVAASAPEDSVASSPSAPVLHVSLPSVVPPLPEPAGPLSPSIVPITLDDRSGTDEN